MTQTNEYVKGIFGVKDNYEQRQIQYLVKENKRRQRTVKKEIRQVEEDILSSTIFNGNRLDVLKSELRGIEMHIEKLEKEDEK